MNITESRHGGAARRSFMTLACLLGVALLAWGGLRLSSGTFFATSAQAAGAPAEPAAEAAPGAGDAGQQPAAAEVAPGGEAQSAANEVGSIFPNDPLETLAQSLRRKQRELDERERTLKDEEARLETLRKEIEERLAESQRVLDAMKKVAGEADVQKKRELSKWVKIYESMQAPQAGAVFQDLDPEFTLQLLAQMDPKKAAKILNEMPPEKAVKLNEKLNARP